MIHLREADRFEFEELLKGKREFDIRHEEENGFSEGDLLAINEVDQGNLSGRCCILKITCIKEIGTLAKHDPTMRILGVKRMGLLPYA